METQRIAEPIDFIKIHCVVIPKTRSDIEFEEFVREKLAKNQTREEIYKNVTTRPDLAPLGCPSYENSKKLNNLISQATSLKKRLETHMDHKNQDSQELLLALKEVIRLVTSYQRDSSDLPFNWVRKCFFPLKFRGWKYSYPEVESWVHLLGIKPSGRYDPLDKHDYKTVDGGSKTAEVSLKDPLCTSNLATPFIAHDLGKAWFYVEHFLHENDQENLPNAKEDKIWLEFKDFDKGTRESEVETNPKFDDGEIKSIGVDHPIVSAVGNFAVDAFNKACKKHVKKGEDNNLHGFEFMECKYLKLGKLGILGACEIYHFYMIIEAIEEGNPGTYMAEVTCNSTNGAKLLCNFFLTDYKPSGMKAMAVSYFYCLESICKTVDDLFEEKLARLKKIYKHTKGPDRPITAGELSRLTRLHAKLQEVLLVRCASARLRCPPDFDRMTNPDGWCDQVDDHHGSGMVRRAKGTSCSGYDYYNPYVDGRDESITGSKGS